MRVTLPNGIVYDRWPPVPLDPHSREPVRPAYLDSPPSEIPVGSAHELFVDDFLIETTTLSRRFHRPVKSPPEPTFGPQTPLEHTGMRYRDAAGFSPPMACTFDDGVFYDEADARYKMWYAAGSGTYTALAYSTDGIDWERPEFDVVPGTNAVLVHPPGAGRDSFSPWIDETDAGPERYKAFLFTTNHTSDLQTPPEGYHDRGMLLTSADGIHWRERAELRCSVGDNTILFYHPLRNAWCLSVRGGPRPHERTREYLEGPGFLELAERADGEKRYWVGADDRDEPDPEIGEPPQIYGVAPRLYEPLFVGVFTVWYGPDNRICLAGGFPKTTEIQLGFSRDGFSWDRPCRDAFLAASRRPGDAERGYLRAAGGGFVVRSDRLEFYYSAYSGIAPDGRTHMYAGGTMHRATLRRDGFASLDATATGGELLTRPLTIAGERLFVNVDAAGGELRAEVVGDDGHATAGLTESACVPVTGDTVGTEVRWRDGALSSATGRPVRIRFRLTSGSLYSFWTQ